MNLPYIVGTRSPDASPSGQGDNWSEAASLLATELMLITLMKNETASCLNVLPDS
jgi:hypothetical protein